MLSMVALIALWFGISVPLVFLGAYFGYKQVCVCARARAPARARVCVSTNPSPLTHAVHNHRSP